MRGIVERIEKGVIVTDEEGNIQCCNTVMLHQLGVKPQEIVGQSIETILDSITPNMTDDKKYTAYLKRNEGGRQAVQIEIEREQWEGNRANYYFIENTSTNLLETILDEMPFSIWVKDREGRYCYGNQYFLNQFRIEDKPYTREGIIGTSSGQLLDQNMSYSISQGIEAVFKSKSSLSYEINTEEKGKLYSRNVHLFPLWDRVKRQEKEFVVCIEEDTTLVKRLDIRLDEELFREYEAIEKNICEAQEDDEVNRIYELDEIKEDLKEKFKFDSLAIGIFTKDEKISVLTYLSDGKSEKKLKRMIPIHKEWYQDALLNLDAWGIKEASEYTKVIPDKLMKTIANFHKYIAIYPLIYCDQLIGMIGIGNIDTKLNISGRLMQKVSKQIALIIKNRAVTYALESKLNLRKEKEHELISFLETAVDLTAIVDDKNKILKIDRRWETQLGWTDEEVLGKTVDQFIHPEDRLRLNNGGKEKKIIYQFNNRVLCKDGGYKWFEWHIDYRSSEKFGICTARDISEKKAHEHEKEAYKQRCVQEKVKNEFFSNVSHEFRTPINIILTSLQLIEGKMKIGEIMEEDKLNKYMRKIRQNTYRLLKLSNNLIDLTKMDVGFESLRLVNHNIVSIIEETTLSGVAYAKNNGIELIFDTEIEEVIMACDVEKIERIILNLLSNAVKFTPRGGRIEVNVFKKGDIILFTVRDTGIGIPKDKHSLIFERFEQVDTSLRRRCEGTGMGLAIVRSIVDMYQGEISVDSIVGKGATFTVSLPISIIENQKVEENLKLTTTPKVEKCTVEFSDIYSY